MLKRSAPLLRPEVNFESSPWDNQKVVKPPLLLLWLKCTVCKNFKSIKKIKKNEVFHTGVFMRFSRQKKSCVIGDTPDHTARTTHMLTYLAHVGISCKEKNAIGGCNVK